MRRCLGRLGPMCVGVLLVSFFSCQKDSDERVILEEITPAATVEDVDQDGYTEQEGDCNDEDGAIHPDSPEGTPDATGALEGDGIDNNCDGRIDEGTLDFDDDQDGYNEREGDCDDTDGQRYPGRVDGCDGIDNDCDGTFDEDARDVFEPNDTSEDAYEVGDLTCTYAPLEFNIDRPGDLDFFRFEVCDNAPNGGCPVECLFWIEVQMQGIPEGLDFQVTLYREVQGELVSQGEIPSTAAPDVVPISLKGTNDADEGGVYYVEVASGEGDAGVSCNNEARLVIFGQIPVELPLPEKGSGKKP